MPLFIRTDVHQLEMMSVDNISALLGSGSFSCLRRNQFFVVPYIDGLMAKSMLSLHCLRTGLLSSLIIIQSSNRPSSITSRLEGSGYLLWCLPAVQHIPHCCSSVNNTLALKIQPAKFAE